MAQPKKTRKESTVATRRKRPTALGSMSSTSTNRTAWLNVGIFVLFAVLFILVAFFGLSPASPVLQEGQFSRVRIVAELPFSFESDNATERKRAALRDRVPPVYRLDNSHLEAFREYLVTLGDELTQFTGIPPDVEDRGAYALTPDEVARFLAEFDGGNPYSLRDRDLAVLWNQLPREPRSQALTEGLLILEQLYREGIYDPNSQRLGPGTSNLRVYNVEDEQGHIRELNLLSVEQALRNLRINLAALDVPRESSIILFRILRNGLVPNLRYDEELTQNLIQETLAEVDPVLVSVPEGQTIIEPGTRVTDAQLEQLEAYRRAQAHNTSLRFGPDKLFVERAMLTVVVLFATMIYLRLTGIQITPNRRRIFLAGTALLLNLLINRLLLEIGDSSGALQNPTLLSLLPFMVPVTLAPILIATLLGAGPGIICGGLIAFLNALMQGNSVAVLLAGTCAALVGIFYARRIEVRTSIVRAGLYGGMIMGAAAILMGLRDSLEFMTVFYQVLTALGVGALTGVVIIGILPIWEALFKTTTSITLLELTDFNHPLLRRMQLEAPGSYHHSLMVANLAENAAATVGANPLMCRSCAFFHDIGKLVKPEYFTENQRDGHNPHLERNPSMSALVIKSHVKEGVVLAKEYKLPRVMIDVIREHHGTSLIQYFYYKALERRRQAEAASGELPPRGAPRIELDQVNEATYRYEGPCPSFTESAIIMLADSIEAAGRSLRKVTPQAIDELIEQIVTARVEDGQLDRCPLTFQQLAKIRESFAFTLLNMLHARVEYPKEALEGEKKSKKKAAKRSGQSPFAELGKSLDQSSESGEQAVEEPPPGAPTGEKQDDTPPSTEEMQPTDPTENAPPR